MNKLSKDKRDKIILVALLTLATSAGIWFALINVQRQALADIRAQREGARQQLTKGQAMLSMSGTIEKQFAQARQELAAEEASMAAATDMYSWLIQTLNTFRAGYGVEIPQFGRELATDVGIFPKFPYSAAAFTIRGTAHYHEFGKFLADFENQFPYIRVQNIELEPAGDLMTRSASNAREKLSFKLELVTLVRPIAP